MKRILVVFNIILITALANAQQPKLMLPVGHTESVDHVGFNSGWSYYFSVSGDGTIKGWEKETGKLLYSTNKGNSFTLSPDSRSFASITEDKKNIIMKSTQNGELQYQFTESLNSFKAVLYSPDNLFLAAISVSPSYNLTTDSNTFVLDSVFISLWNRATGKLAYKEFTGISQAKSISAGETLNFSPDGKYVVSTTLIQKQLKVWEVKSGKLVHTLSGNTYAIENIVFSPDGKLILEKTILNECSIWNIEQEKKVGSFKCGLALGFTAEFSKGTDYILTQGILSTDTAFVWDAHTGHLLYSLPKDRGTSFLKTSFSRDGKFVFYSVEKSAMDHLINAMEIKTGKIIYSFKHTYKNKVTGEDLAPTVEDILFSPDQNYIITKSLVGNLKVWDRRSGGFMHSLGNEEFRSNKIEFSDDGNYVIQIYSEQTYIWDYRTGKLLKKISFTGHSFSVKASDISPDGRFIATALSDNMIRVAEIKTGKIIRYMQGHNAVITSVKYSSDGKFIVSTSHDKSAKVWETETGRLIETLSHPNIVLDARFSPDSKHIVTACGDQNGRIWNVDNAVEEYILTGHTEIINSVEYSPDGKYIITTSTDNKAIGWESATGKLLYTLTHQDWVMEGFYSPDGKVIVTKTIFGGLYFWDSDFRKGKMNLLKSFGPFSGTLTFQYSADGKNEIYWFGDSVRILNVKENVVTNHYFPEGKKEMIFSPAGDYLITYSNSELKVFDTENFKLKYKLIAIDSLDYLNIDEQGRFDGTEAARKMLYYVCGNEIIDLDQIKDLCWEPGIVSKIMGVNNEPIKAKRLDEISICGNTPIIENREETKDHKKFIVKRRSGGIGEVAIYINQKEVEKIPVASLVFNNNEAIVIVDLKKYSNYFESGKENSVQLRARTSDLSISSKGAVLTLEATEKITTAPNLYAIIAGVSDYKGDALDLKFAAKDASDFSNALQLASRKLLNIDGKEHVFVTTLVSGSSTPPVKENIRKAFEELKLKAKPNDIIVVYVSGHGEKFGTETTNFYYLTADAASFNLAGVEKEVAISTNEFADWLKAIPARKQLLILDACASGKLAEDMAIAMRAAVPSDQIKALDRLNSRTGTFILSGAAANQSAYETSKYGQGLLTYSLLYGMKSGEGLKDNSFVDVDKLFQYCADKVKELAAGIGGIQDPVISKPAGGASFDIGKVDQDIASKIILALPKIIFTNSKFSNRETDDDNMGLEKIIDNLFIEYASKGNESKLVFTERSQLAESYKLVGSYQVTGDKISITVRVKKGTEEIQKFEIIGSVNDKENLAKQIFEKVQATLN